MGLIWECDHTVLGVYVFLRYINDVMLFFCMPALFSPPSPSFVFFLVFSFVYKLKLSLKNKFVMLESE